MSTGVIASLCMRLYNIPIIYMNEIIYKYWLKATQILESWNTLLDQVIHTAKKLYFYLFFNS